MVKIKRTPYPNRYTDSELYPFFDWVYKGYCYKQSSELMGYDAERMLRTMYSDDDISGFVLELSMAARTLIENGEIPVPDRWDGLYDEYRGLHESKFNIFN